MHCPLRIKTYAIISPEVKRKLSLYFRSGAPIEGMPRRSRTYPGPMPIGPASLQHRSGIEPGGVGPWRGSNSGNRRIHIKLGDPSSCRRIGSHVSGIKLWVWGSGLFIEPQMTLSNCS